MPPRQAIAVKPASAAPAEDEERATDDRTVVIGVPEVVDSGTLRFGPRTVRLDGVAGLEGRPAEQMASYIGDRLVSCNPTRSQHYRCKLGGWDLSEVVLFNGGGRPTADAAPELAEAARNARDAGRGVWASR